jgi:hypothetical protein
MTKNTSPTTPNHPTSSITIPATNWAEQSLHVNSMEIINSVESFGIPTLLTVLHTNVSHFA